MRNRGISCNGECTTTCHTACSGCSTMCAYTAEKPEHIMLSSAGETSMTDNEKIKSIPTECSACGAQAEIRPMGFLFIKECPYCKKKEVISIQIGEMICIKLGYSTGGK